MYLTEDKIRDFENSLYLSEKSRATVIKYSAALHGLRVYLAGNEISKQRLLEYRDLLLQKRRANTVNGALSAINSYLEFSGLSGCRVKLLKIQRQAFTDERRELSEAEYRRLLSTALKRGKKRLYLIMLTLCSTGIRVSELPFITVEAALSGRAEIRLKGKTRTVLMPRELRRRLREYCRLQGIASGSIFRTRSGRPMDRSNIFHEMKGLCAQARVDSKKVFPHNFRHLFARSFYSVEKNLAHLADVLGHSSVETTRIYVAVSASAHEKTLSRMQLVI